MLDSLSRIEGGVLCIVPAASAAREPNTALTLPQFIFAPCTRQAMEAMVRVDTCSNGDELCEPVLAFDNGQKYLQGEHVVASAVAFGVIVLVAVIVPLVLISKVRHAKTKRGEALAANVQQMGRWFKIVDANKSGMIDIDEMEQLLKLMGESFI